MVYKTTMQNSEPKHKICRNLDAFILKLIEQGMMSEPAFQDESGKFIVRTREELEKSA